MATVTARNLVEVTASVTRPANPTQYASGDVIDAATGAGLTFASAARGEGLGGTIRDAVLISTEGAATSLDVELWLFTGALAAYDNDNAAFSPLDADYHTLSEGITTGIVGVIPFAAANAYIGTSGVGGNMFLPATRTFLPMEFVCAGDSTSLYGVLVVRGTYTPASGEGFRVKMRIDQA